MEKFQSAYTENPSTETALLYVINNIYKEVDKGRVVCLVLLDLSGAFDMVMHDPLLNRLQFWHGRSGSSVVEILPDLQDTKSCCKWGFFIANGH